MKTNKQNSSWCGLSSFPEKETFFHIAKFELLTVNAFESYISKM